MEDEAERIVGSYRGHARAWVADRGNMLPEGAWLDRFLALLPAGGAVLDIGCGSGEPIGRYAVGRGHPVTGVDASPGMIGLCRERLPDQGWRVADMRTLSLGRAFDGIFAWDSFFHLRHEDQGRMFPIFREHAAPGAALMFTSGPGCSVAIGSYRGEPLHHASLDVTQYRTLLEANGFCVVAHVIDDPTCGGHTVWLALLG